MMTSPAWRDEWRLLQAQHEQYEHWTLAIKLLAVLLTAFAPLSATLLALLLAVLWLQDAICKTFQARLGERLLRIEAALRGTLQQPAQPMQLHSEWQAVRPGTLALLAAYARSACRPTVAFPYPVLMLLPLLPA